MRREWKVTWFPHTGPDRTRTFYDFDRLNGFLEKEEVAGCHPVVITRLVSDWKMVDKLSRPGDAVQVYTHSYQQTHGTSDATFNRYVDDGSIVVIAPDGTEYKIHADLVESFVLFSKPGA